MNPLRAMNAALAYIESHLADSIELDAAARTAGYSAYYFKRMFSSLAM